VAGVLKSAESLRMLSCFGVWGAGSSSWSAETRALIRQQLDATVINYIGSSLGVLLNIVLVVVLRVGILPVLHFLWLRERYGLRCHWVLRLPRGTYIKVRHAASMPEFIRLEW